jgi:hypothetical protein
MLSLVPLELQRSSAISILLDCASRVKMMGEKCLALCWLGNITNPARLFTIHYSPFTSLWQTLAVANPSDFQTDYENYKHH